MFRRLAGAVAWATATFAVAAAAADSARPNILWITVEDMSPSLGSYGDADARTPHLDRFAREAVRYTHAFATAPVCSPSRSCLITGLYATSLGTQRLRSQFPLPAEIGPFTAGLRRLGYYTSNNVKTDYNFADEPAFVRAAWDESSARAHWRKRAAGQPFFAIFNLMTTHQSRTSAWPAEEFEREVGAKLAAAERHDPARLTLPAFYPDTPGARQAWARYHDCITLMDRQVGEILAELAADGLADDTIVFFYSDHGMGMPRGKRTLYDSGLHVPLLIRFPAKWRHLAPAAPGTTLGELVSFVDFAPTVLSLAGAPAPAHLQGRAFLGRAAAAAPAREYVFGARDRVDEAFDLSRSVRDRRWLYIRNYMPHLPGLQPEAYSDTSTFRRELRQLAGYALAPRPREELFDTVADPQQLQNLAADPRHAATLARLRAALRTWQLETRDLGFATEPEVWAALPAVGTPLALAHDSARYPLPRLLDAAAQVGAADAATALPLLRDPHAGVRYWAAVALHARPQLADAERAALRAALSDTSPAVRIEAAAALARAGAGEAALPVLVAALRDESLAPGLHAARALELLGPRAAPVRPALQARLALARAQEQAGTELAMFIRFALESALAD
jgi:arylsulfatase A-like enzyme